MARCLFIVQGEGRGHLSQSVALKEYLEESGHTVEAVFAGCNNRRPLPGYYHEVFREKLNCFSSPFFLRTPNKKGIYVGRTILFNLFRSIRYLLEAERIRREIIRLDPDVVFNFYDVVGAMALRKTGPGIQRISIGHHFFLHLDGYRCSVNKPLHERLLKIHTRMIMKYSDQVLALSFREVPGNEQIRVVPPLVRKQIRKIRNEAGSRYLVYLLNEGFVSDLIHLAREDPGFKVDLFSDLPEDTPVPAGIRLHKLDDKTFMEKMAGCRGLITTAGFDSVAEAAYVGAPLAVVPVRNHFEQQCNSKDVERSGLGVASDVISEGVVRQMKEIDNISYRQWVDRTGQEIINHMEG